MINGKETVVKVGKTKSGVTLIDIKNSVALLEVNGQRQQVSLSKQISGSYKKPLSRIVRIPSQEGGHYWVKGEMNGFSVDFIVDTGATMISMNLSTAKRLGINYEAGKGIRLSTANGITKAWLVEIKKVTVGKITKYNIAATVSSDDALPAVLLGNSFLNGLDISIENGVLILESNL